MLGSRQTKERTSFRVNINEIEDMKTINEKLRKM